MRSPRRRRPTARARRAAPGGRSIDTTNDPIIAQRAPQPWRSWQRSEDYYSEGQLIWIDVDRIIRAAVRRQALDRRFRQAFFGVRDRDYGELTYTFDDVVATLNKVQPYDWRGYLQRRVYDVAPEAPLEGITQGGYRLVFTDEPTKWIKSAEKNAQEQRPHLFGRLRRRQ